MAATKETSEQIAARLMAPATTSAWWTHDQVRALVIEAAESAPSSAAERSDARAGFQMIKDAMGELFGPLASVAHEDAVPAPLYRHEAEAIIAGLQRIADRLALNEAAAAAGGSIAVEGENWTGEAHETARDMDAKVRAIAPFDAPKGSAGR